MQVRKPVVTKAASFTLDMYQVKSGSRITTRGATGAVTATLPTPPTGSMSWDGYSVEFHGGADQNLIVSAGAAKALVFNNLAAASLAAQTGGQKIGAVIVAVWDGAAGKWHLTGITIGVTYTVA
jgi:hypothetical protein